MRIRVGNSRTPATFKCTMNLRGAHPPLGILLSRPNLRPPFPPRERTPMIRAVRHFSPWVRGKSNWDEDQTNTCKPHLSKCHLQLTSHLPALPTHAHLPQKLRRHRPRSEALPRPRHRHRLPRLRDRHEAAPPLPPPRRVPGTTETPPGPSRSGRHARTRVPFAR